MQSAGAGEEEDDGGEGGAAASWEIVLTGEWVDARDSWLN
jgi:hypothetical protein